jgi:hypothetical protein
MGFSEWRREFYNKRREFLRWGKTIYGGNKILENIMREVVRTSKIKNLRRVTIKIRNFHLLEVFKS